MCKRDIVGYRRFHGKNVPNRAIAPRDRRSAIARPAQGDGWHRRAAAGAD
jgi:hypothetical protein